KKIFGFIFLSLAIYVLMAAGFMYFKQENMIFAPEVLPPDFKFAFQERFEEINWPVDGARINALHFKAAQPKGIVLYFHGNAGSLKSWGDVAQDFTQRGYDIVIPDYRGFGKSTGRIENEKMLLKDAETAYDYVKKHFSENQIILYGRSIGTGMAVHLARTSRPRMVILESPYLSLLDMAARHYPLFPRPLLRLLVRYPLRTDLWIADVTCPVYLFHGERDNIIPFSESEQLSKLVRSEHQLIAVPEGGHNNLGDFRQYREALDRILR
ncbi:MAG: alpha/beta hydrolase, partial [Syntrophus sp. (in: bacteria)]|nr:alpha/beta hydrolase [Syntrophus sp. (in: bacteria)]